MLSKIFTIFIYGLVNLLLVVGLVPVTKFYSHGLGALESQLLQIFIIIFITDFVDYIVINKKN